jgi:hypothetical protein
MAERAFREEQWAHRYDEHIAPINRLVDDLSQLGHGWLPYVAPMYGGVSARLLSLLRDPGPKTKAGTGSAFLSMENDDPTAEAISAYFADAGIPAQQIVPWNAYPWYINRDPTPLELDLGLQPLLQLIELLPRLRVVMLHGGAAKRSWRRFIRRYPNIVSGRHLQVISTYHTSRQAFRHKNPAIRSARKEHLRSAFRHAATLLSDVAFSSAGPNHHTS